MNGLLPLSTHCNYQPPRIPEEIRPFVTIIMPVRNEARHIVGSLRAIMGQDYPRDRMEILVVDGMSQDGTREEIISVLKRTESGKDASSRDREPIRLRILDNPLHITSAALNVGLREAKGEIVVLVGGHCEIAQDYVRQCVKSLGGTRADCVGGPMATVGETWSAQAIALAQSSPFGVGGVVFRIGQSTAGYVDTVAFGAYQGGVFSRIGGFDEELVRNQDDEFNFRSIQAGGKIWLDPSIRSIYYSRANLRSLWNQYFEYGLYKVRVIQKRKAIPSWRHLVPGAFALALLATFVIALLTGQWLWGLVVAGPYAFMNIAASLWTARRDWKTLPLLPVAFLTLHLSYGIGFLGGLWKWRKKWREGPEIPLAQSMLEVDRINEVYRAYREREVARVLWDEKNPGNREILRERTDKTQKLLTKYGFNPLEGRKILDVGCGSGKVLASLAESGAQPENLFGVDLLPDRIEEARQSYPDMSFLCANAEHLNFAKESFDLVLLFTVFSSILDGNMARNIAAEVHRLLKPGGAILWYDFRYNNPNNPNVRGIWKEKIRTLFPEFRTHLHTTTLLPPLARKLGRLTPIAYPFLTAIPVFRTHYLGLMIKKE